MGLPENTEDGVAMWSLRRMFDLTPYIELEQSCFISRPSMSSTTLSALHKLTQKIEGEEERKGLFNDDTAKTVIRARALVSVIPFASEGQNADQLGERKDVISRWTSLWRAQ